MAQRDVIQYLNCGLRRGVAFTESWWLSFSFGFSRWICSCASPVVVGVVVGPVTGTVVGVVFDVLASGPVVGGWGGVPSLCS